MYDLYLQYDVHDTSHNEDDDGNDNEVDANDY